VATSLDKPTYLEISSFVYIRPLHLCCGLARVGSMAWSFFNWVCTDISDLEAVHTCVSLHHTLVHCQWKLSPIPHCQFCVQTEGMSVEAFSYSPLSVQIGYEWGLWRMSALAWCISVHARDLSQCHKRARTNYTGKGKTPWSAVIEVSTILKLWSVNFRKTAHCVDHCVHFNLLLSTLCTSCVLSIVYWRHCMWACAGLSHTQRIKASFWCSLVSTISHDWKNNIMLAQVGDHFLAVAPEAYARTKKAKTLSLKGHSRLQVRCICKRACVWACARGACINLCVCVCMLACGYVRVVLA
jgi:hypothetical protein